MNFWFWAGEAVFIVLHLFLFLFLLCSWMEKEYRAFKYSLGVFLLGAALNVSFLFVPLPLRSWLFGSVFFLFSVGILFLFLSLSPRKEIKIPGKQQQMDERDIVFSRFDLEKGSPRYKEYYQNKPQYKGIDDEIRKLPDILSSSHIKRNPLPFSLADAEFEFLEHQLDQVSGEKSSLKTQLSLSQNTRMLKDVMKYLGADLSGVCELDPAYIYSHVGRGPEPYGSPITLSHKYALVFAVEMDYDTISTAPQAPVIVETGNKYVKAALISIILSHFLRNLGYSARAHIAGSNYQALLPPLAWKAGLGELGRLGLLITWEHGPRVRLGLVTTDLPLVPDQPQVGGIQDFCENCQKCARNCPAQAISFGEKKEENGVLKWTINREECYKFWRKCGTDCAVCLTVCPYSKPSNLFHNLIRKGAARSRALQRLFIKGDDFFYGSYPRRKIQRRFLFPL